MSLFQIMFYVKGGTQKFTEKCQHIIIPFHPKIQID